MGSRLNTATTGVAAKVRSMMNVMSIALIGTGSLVVPCLQAALSPSKLRCEYLSEPRGIHEAAPRLSWIVESKERNQVQTAWQVLVSSTAEKLAANDGDRWDSGKVVSEETCQIEYEGADLASRDGCFWKVRVWDGSDERSEWSAPASWTMGLLQPGDWAAQWVDGHRIAAGSETLPTLVSASYEALDGAGSLDVTTQLTHLAGDGEFELPVSNASFGNDPAYNHVKQLRVVYELDGYRLEAAFPENTTFHFPDDLPPFVAVAITGASYEALDGAGARDVTPILTALAAEGPFVLSVDNDSLGGDPAADHLKRLRITYEKDGFSMVKFVEENTVFRFPADLAVPAAVPYLRKSFAVDKAVRRATVYVTALGIYELRINGGRVGDHVLAPEWTDYEQRLNYQVYDVTPMIDQGENVWGAQLANGWFSGHIGNGGYQYWGSSPALLGQLEIEYVDGSRQTIVTDSSWKIGVGPLVSTDFMLGEDYDARREIPGWDAAGFDDSGWTPVTLRTVEPRAMTGQVMEPSRELMTLPAKELTEPAAGKWTYDLGQNMVGVVRLKITAPAGTQITLRHGEMLNPDGTLYTANLRGAPSIDHYTCQGGGEETWQPKFTFHGFRYVELTGVDEQPPLDAVTGVVIGSDTPKAGSFSCSDPLINQLQSNIEWGQRGNYLSVPTDCPQRDERLGWMGDAQVFVRTATYNSDVAAFFNKWLADVTDSQLADGRFTDVCPYAGPSVGTPAWGDAGVICPWTIYQAYGDKRVLEKAWDSMVAWISWCESQSNNYIRSGNRGSDYGDWLSIGADTSKELLATAYFAYSTHLVAKTAEVLGKTTEAASYQAKFEAIKAAFNDKYVDATGRITGNTQCAYAMALKFDLLPPALRSAAADYLAADIAAKGDHLSTGFVGVGYLLPVLTAEGKSDVAYKLIHQDTFPSWLFSIKYGATTIWERWDGWTPDKGFQSTIMNSFNHYSLGSCGEWLYSAVGGIDQQPDTAGYKDIVIRPVPGGKIDQASASLDTIRGRVSSRWMQHEEGFALSVEIPANARATVFVPAESEAAVKESGKAVADAEGVEFLRMEGGAAVFEVKSGRYWFTTGTVPPGTDSAQHDAGVPLRLEISALLGNDGVPVPEFVSADAVSVGGASIEVVDGLLIYRPDGSVAGDDWFNYTVRMPDGGLEMRSVRVTLIPEDAPEAASKMIDYQGDRSRRVVFQGVPGRVYRVEFSDDLGSEGEWQLLATLQAGPSGMFEATDLSDPPASRFYRAAFP
ncbi:family 78 glycoside hydrolase catalytic domain [Haloferula sargassicola]|uniref:alpha-L-rhamnosidase n=1 Tax=Haloferula sargassicola TaxID=490096 RepID=A0ABP9UP32_9BACT